MEIIITLIVIAGLFLFIRKYEQEHSAVKTLQREGYVVKETSWRLLYLAKR